MGDLREPDRRNALSRIGFGLRRQDLREKALRAARILQKLLGIDKARIIGIEFTDDERGPVILVTLEPHASVRSRCPHCEQRCPGYDRPNRPRQWRHLDMGGTRCFVQASVSRIRCPEHGVVTEMVPWARPAANMTRAFDDNVAWLAAHSPATSVCEYARVAWRSVTRIVTRVVGDAVGRTDRLQGLRRLGIDEIAYRKGHRYLTVVVDHDTGRLVWAAEGHNESTLNRFFDELGEERTARLTHISADAAKWIASTVRSRAPQVKRCMDPFHVIQWMTRALDRLRSRVLSRLWGFTDRDRRHLRWALLKNVENLTPAQISVRAKILEDRNSELCRGYVLKEQLQHVYSGSKKRASVRLRVWVQMAQDSGIPELVGLAKSIARYRREILNAIEYDLSNARVEANNTHLRSLTKRSYGFHSPEALIAMATLTRGGACPPLPQR